MSQPIQKFWVGCLVFSVGRLAAGVFGQVGLSLGLLVGRSGAWVHGSCPRSWVHMGSLDPGSSEADQVQELTRSDPGACVCRACSSLEPRAMGIGLQLEASGAIMEAWAMGACLALRWPEILGLQEFPQHWGGLGTWVLGSNLVLWEHAWQWVGQESRTSVAGLAVGSTRSLGCREPAWGWRSHPGTGAGGFCGLW